VGLYYINKEAFSKKMKFAIFKRTFEKKEAGSMGFRYSGW